MKKETLYRFLKRKGACQSALEFARGKTDLEAWRACHNPYWLIWIIAITASSFRAWKKYQRLWVEVEPVIHDAGPLGSWSIPLSIIRRHYPRPPKRPKE